MQVLVWHASTHVNSLTARSSGRGVTGVQNDPGSHDDHFPLLGLRDLRIYIPVDKVLWLCLPSKTFHVSSRPNAELLGNGMAHIAVAITNPYHMMRGCKSETCSISEAATGLSHMSHPHRAPVLRLRDGWLFFRCWRSLTRVPERKVRSGRSVLMDSHAITNSGPSRRVVVQKRKVSRIAEPGKAGRSLKIFEVGS